MRALCQAVFWDMHQHDWHALPRWAVVSSESLCQRSPLIRSPYFLDQYTHVCTEDNAKGTVLLIVLLIDEDEEAVSDGS